MMPEAERGIPRHHFTESDVRCERGTKENEVTGFELILFYSLIRLFTTTRGTLFRKVFRCTTTESSAQSETAAGHNNRITALLYSKQVKSYNTSQCHAIIVLFKRARHEQWNHH
jgi:hypothetical protein